MTLTAEHLKNKVLCPRPGTCNNRTVFKIIHEYLPVIDGEVYYHVECQACGYHFSVEQKEIYGSKRIK